MHRYSNNSTSKFITTISWAILILLSMALYNNLKSYFSLKEELAGLEKTFEEVQSDNKKTQMELLFLNDPYFLEKTIRERLLLQRPGDNVYIVPISPSPTPIPNSPSFSNQKSFWRKWWGRWDGLSLIKWGDFWGRESANREELPNTRIELSVYSNTFGSFVVVQDMIKL